MRLCILLGREYEATALITSIRDTFPLIRVLVPERWNDQALERTYPQLLRRVAKSTVQKCLQEENPTIVLSVAWPYLLETDVLNGPWKSFNCHPSLLPKYRGVSSFYHMIVLKEPHGGATFHEIDEGMDTGDILLQESFPIDDYDTWVSVRAKAEECRQRVILKSLACLEKGDVHLYPQDHTKATCFPKRRTPSDSEFDPSRSVMDIFDHVRGCDDERFPAYFYTKDGTKIYVSMWRDKKPAGSKNSSL